MKKQLLVFLFFISNLIAFSQQYGNEWINYNQTYFKFTVSTEGIYRIPSSVINQFGLNFIDANNFQLFRDGQEIPIYVNATNNLANYIEFYAYPNDGKLDAKLFKDPNWQMHDRYSLFTDEAAYYLTWNSTGNNLRIENTANSLSNLPPKENYFFHTVRNLFTGSFSSGKTHYIDNNALYNSIFDKGEGFYSSSQFNNSSNTLSYNVNTPRAFAGIDATLNTVVVSWSNNQHSFNIKSGSTTLASHLFSEFDLIKDTLNFPSNLIGNTSNVTFQAVSTSSGTNRNTPALIELTYARDFDFQNASQFIFTIQGNGSAQYVEITNLDEQGTYPILYDITNGYRITATDVPGSTIHRFALPAATGSRKLVLRADNAANYTSVSALQQMSFVNFNSAANQGDYILLSSSDFINTNEINSYVAHRESFIGGQHNVVKVDIQQLYDQFAWGIDKHPQAIRSFVDFITDNWSVSPRYLFIVGKGREYKDFRTNTAVRAACKIPTFGDPGSDILLAADNNGPTPKIAIGRLAATTTNQLNVYLQKIIQYDNEFYNYGDPYQTIAQKDFLKQIVHMGGGTDLSQQNTFRNYLNSYAALAADTLWGAKTSSVFKNSSAPIQTIPSELIRNRINDGVSLITFFGHSYAGGFDISFDDPENYTNTGKYPVFLANGCNSGLIHGGSQSISERFVFQNQKGAIAYMATADLSASSSLNTYTRNFYLNLSGAEYATSLGEIIKNTVQNVQTCCSNTSQGLDLMIAQEMTLHGDPAIPFNQYDHPDYDIESQNVYFTPNTISTSLDSFTVNLVVYNLGKAINDSINAEVTRIYPNGLQEVLVKRVKAPYYNDTISINFPVNGVSNGLGLNHFNIYVDVDDEVSNELSETNNYLLNQISLAIGSDDIFPIYPYEFAIVPNQGVTLKSSTGNPFEVVKNYIYQIDTSELFLNPLAEEVITSPGGVVEWTPAITMQDSVVYYWRVSVDSSATNPYKWHYSSFIYLAGEYPGWNQSHYYQWQKDNYQNVYLDTDRTFKFIDVPKEVFVRTGLYPTLFYEEMEWKLDGAQMHNWKMNNCGGGVGFPNGLSIALINNLTGLPIPIVNNSTTSSYGPYGNIHCVGVENTITVANFRASGNTPANHPTPGVPWSDLIIDYLNNAPNNYYVLVYSINNPSYASWSINLFNYLNSLGNPVAPSTNGPMIFVYQKNNNAFTPIVNIGNSFSDIISETFQITGTWTDGNYKSTLIGPALEWGSFHWREHALENPTTDNVSVDIYGVNNNVETFIMNVPSSTTDVSIQNIDATMYPYIRLQYKTIDNVDRTPSQNDYWRVLYKIAPEAAINPKKYFAVNKDTLEQGEAWNVAVAIENVTEIDMDSLTVKNSLFDAGNNAEISYTKFDSLNAFDTLHITYNKNTATSNMVGTNLLVLEANPYEQDHQREQFHFNNFAQVDFDVIQDKINPLLDVSFDGIKILDGDLVSAQPEIKIVLKDNNTYLALDDTSLLQVYFRYMGIDGNSPEGLIHESYNNAGVQFIPSNSTTKNEAQLIINKEFMQDGYYEMLVRAKDKSNNTSSSTDNRLDGLVYYDYKISFQVINASMISNVLNYPNPFTTQTQFVFTLTGSKIPDFVEIQIMNIKGTIVKTIRQDEIGPLHIGVNRTNYWWNGKDEYGDALANGVYFYRVKTSINDEAIDHLDIQQVDQYFKKGIGKMVLIR